MVRLRLSRFGAKKHPCYRFIATDQRSPRNGRFLERLGTYDPMKEPMEIKIDLARVDFWLALGAQPSETVKRLIDRARKDAPPAGAK